MSTKSGKSPSLLLAEHEVHVWSAHVSELRDVLITLETHLDEEEIRRADKYRFAEDRALFVACRGVLRALLAKYTGHNPALVQIGTGPVGKPYLKTTEGISSIRFNVSHSHGRVLLGFSRDREVGVDVEQVRAIDDLDGLAQRYFAPEEQADLANRDLPNRLRHFFTIWALKEAFLKGTGKGLTTALDSFYVCAAGSPSQSTRYGVIRRDGASLLRWGLTSVQTIPGFAAAIAVDGAGWELCERSGQELIGLLLGP